MTKRTIWNASKYGLGFVLLAGIIWRNWSTPEGSGPGLADALQRPLQVAPLALAVLCCVFGLILTFIRWFILVRAQDLPFTITNAFRLGLVGYFFNSFLPGAVGGDIIKAAFIAREQSRRTVAVATVLLDRAIGLWALFWVVGGLGVVFWFAGDAALHSQKSLQVILLAALGIVCGTMLLWFALGYLPEWRAHRFAGRLQRLPKVGGSAAEFWRAVWLYRCRGRSMALALGLAILGHLGFVLQFYFAAQVLQDPAGRAQLPSLPEQFVIVPVGMTIESLFPSPGGVGGGEFGYGRLFALVGSLEVAGVLASLVKRMVNWGLGFLGYLLYLQMRPALRALPTVSPALGRDASPIARETAVA